MWIVTRDGFFSVVRKDCNEDEALVRARKRSDVIKVARKLNLLSFRLTRTPGRITGIEL